MTKTEAAAAVEKYGSQHKAARALGVSRRQVRKLLGVVVSSNASPPSAGRSLAEFRSTFDKSFIVPQRIKAALKELGAGWEYEVPFSKAAGVSLADLGNFREQFIDHVVQVERGGRRAWAGTKAVAAQMRAMI
jgi:hypothetical protein